jgi:hypothetical protein
LHIFLSIDYRNYFKLLSQTTDQLVATEINIFSSIQVTTYKLPDEIRNLLNFPARLIAGYLLLRMLESLMLRADSNA